MRNTVKNLVYLLVICLAVSGCTPSYFLNDLIVGIAGSTVEGAIDDLAATDKEAMYLFRVEGDFSESEDLLNLEKTILNIVEAEHFVAEEPIEDATQVDPKRVQEIKIQRDKEKYLIQIKAEKNYTKVLVAGKAKTEEIADSQVKSMTTFLIRGLLREGFKVLRA